MTREEAIECLSERISIGKTCEQSCMVGFGVNIDTLDEAFDMAISALRQQEHFRDLTKKVELMTLDEIRDMSCEPVYIVAGYVSWWDIVSYAGLEYLYLKLEGSLPFRDFGKNWTAYRQKPEEGTV